MVRGRRDAALLFVLRLAQQIRQVRRFIPLAGSRIAALAHARATVQRAIAALATCWHHRLPLLVARYRRASVLISN